VLLILIAVPGGNVDASFGFTVVVLAHHEHGWPFVWLDRCDWPAGGFLFDPGLFAGLGELRWASDGDAFWMTLDDWPLSHHWLLNWKGLVLDLLVALAVTAAIAFPWEWWRRRRFQYRLRSLFVFVFLVSAILAWWRTAAVQWAREQEAIDAVDLVGFSVDTSSAAPEWLRRLVGSDCFPKFVVGIQGSMSDQQGAENMQSALFAVARQFRNLESVEMPMADDRTMMRLGALSADLGRLHASAGLRKVDVMGTDVTDAGLEHLKGLVQLRELDVRYTKVTAEGVKKLKQRLPNCNITWEPRTEDQ
jgi:hypothetical protein